MKNIIPDRLIPVFFSRARQKKQPIETYMEGLLNQIAQKITEEQSFTQTVDDNIALSQWVMMQAIKRYGSKNVVVAWTGGKDSTLILWMIREACKKNKVPMPRCLFINEGHVFEEIKEFVAQITKKWKLNVTEVRNDNVLEQGTEIGAPVVVAKLDTRNQEEVKRLGFKKKTFPFEPESFVGNHLMKTVAMNRYLEKHPYAAVITGIRWDEQEARANETYFSKREGRLTPTHMRIHPILHFTERAIWDAILDKKIPYCTLYKQGYRSLGAKGTTIKADVKPAWEQDFSKIKERAGRRQDKENIMGTLRKLGYM
ncbi:adenylyltransferase [Candidatus Roizmanbacteria bacterium CG10_big_fil_rev_8_21_14_0_10_45_7]|uniref:Adenylyltransferase n=1 Tax=Candidatus Roizmanbacteria bacterium CG10_big_fil_rev_8_21_14_0_10_45_7 TaxID=1974854 RepID=A0A2M8KUC9_9BACT|nr:MAG: adenylyltransferase [Candidatus Roizmanbacteria bacterium CG10_big_fil_rev_8_21_14_0_10_45_7]